MKAQFPIPTQEAASAVSLPWTAVIEPLMGLWEPVFLAGHPALYHCPSLARAFAKGHPGATAIDMGVSAARPTVERIREVANPPRTIPISFDIEAMDAYGAPNERSSFDAWGR